MLSSLLRRYTPWLLTMAALTLAMAIKFLLANATVKTLDFLLQPPAKLVSFCFSVSSTWDAEKGYVFPELNMYINKSCAAINFLVILFLALSTLVIFYTSGKRRTKGIVLVLLISYPLCILVNSFRILVSVQMQGFTQHLSLALQGTLHELTGGICFFGSLLLLLWMAEKTIQKQETGNTIKCRQNSLAIMV